MIYVRDPWVKDPWTNKELASKHEMDRKTAVSIEGYGEHAGE